MMSLSFAPEWEVSLKDSPHSLPADSYRPDLGPSGLILPLAAKILESCWLSLPLTSLGAREWRSGSWTARFP